MSFVALVLCTMMHGAEIELDVPDFEESGVAASREAPLGSGSTVPRMSRKKRYVAFPEGSSFSVRKWI